MFRLSKIKMVHFDQQTAANLLRNDYNNTDIVNAVEHLVSEPSVIIEVIGENCTNKMKSLAGDTNPSNCSNNTLRGIYGSSLFKNAVYVSSNPNSYKSDCNLLFDNRNLQETAQFNNCTACIVKPHSI